MEENKKILITGGMGFIGSNFIRLMLEKFPDNKFINFDKLTYAGNPENLQEIEGRANYQFIKGDICDARMVDAVMKKSDSVVHFAAESHVDRSIEGSNEFIPTNVFGTDVLLNSALKYGVEKFIMISTDEVYGDIPPGEFSKEKDRLVPRNPYAASKAGAELLAHSYYETHGLPVIITRSSNNYGPYQFPEKLIPLFITNILQGKKVPLYGDGLNIRDWIYVEDNCKAIARILEKGKLGDIYNIGGDNERSNIDITNALLSALGKDDSMIEYVEDRKGHDRRYAMDSSKIKNELGWEPETIFSVGIRKTIEWYKENPEWWRTLKNCQ